MVVVVVMVVLLGFWDFSNKSPDVLARLPVRRGDGMHPGDTSVMPLAEPYEIGSALHPRAERIRVAHPRIIPLEQGEVDRIGEREFNMSVVKFKFAAAVVCPGVRASSGCTRATAIFLEVYVVRIPLSGLVRRVVEEVGVAKCLVMRRRDLGHHNLPAA